MVTGARRWARLEREAVSLCTYGCRLVPGSLQSEAYARAVFGNSIPLLTDEQTEAQATARRKRRTMSRSGRRCRSASSWRSRFFDAGRAGRRCRRACWTMCVSSPPRAM
ncbi:Scr1 family TA system antitoxin-like transcriptional regulator [Streptomyces sp. NPDC058442]|uniref:Scr1 family TA system antitoxin-like transcriptional regulator n=1 Tax=Streptomyces sp. NPDC058442 TaxID=3346503 RepID=UPI003665709B